MDEHKEDYDFEWENEHIFKTVPMHPADPIAKPLPPAHSDEIMLPPAYNATGILSKFINEGNLEEFTKSVRDSKYWAKIRFDPAFVEDFSNAKIPDEVKFEKDSRQKDGWKWEEKQDRRNDRVDRGRQSQNQKRDRPQDSHYEDRQPKRHQQARLESGSSPTPRDAAPPSLQGDRAPATPESGKWPSRSELVKSPPRHKSPEHRSPHSRVDAGEQQSPFNGPGSDSDVRPSTRRHRRRSVSSQGSQLSGGEDRRPASPRSHDSPEYDNRSSPSRSSSLTPLEAELLGEDSGVEGRKKPKTASPKKLKGLTIKRRVKQRPTRVNEAYK